MWVSAEARYRQAKENIARTAMNKHERLTFPSGAHANAFD
jgi:hypothetical protein